ncbi:MAG: DUF3110 domain-containing protein [Moorea sp. SIO3I7]|nr:MULTISPECIES: DUF3110 domain-containing protein [unclassified Moorena]NEO02329.1 DUF3110 domain-containing protein [Moorena sp. SIO3I7]NEO09773.1 DUF3110 domain-containing protein [Moorena sp. SIO3I8]NEO14162.1 DUF3110 domain-containing protein [Moorena sp. SIO3E8]NEO21003.1 DUF3110 domain-containing protein [Moorena sp. SIO4A5]NEP22791.1 DUF3110 domain-containing protein [Moorena sp. SIO3I6]
MMAPKQVYVLLFNARTENEGIHTIQIGDKQTVLMFEEEDDATRFALLLEAQDFPTATVEAIDLEEIEEFCQSAGYDSELVTEGMLAMPPETNLEKTDWQPDVKKTEEPEISELDRIRRQLENLL